MKTMNWFTEFWSNLGNFFTERDAHGLSYLSRIFIAIAIIVFGWLIIKFLSFLLKKAFGISKKGPNIDVSAKFFVVTITKIILWLMVAFLVISVLKIDVTGFAGITSAITVALGLAFQDLIACFASGVIILQQKHIRTGDYISVQNSYGSCEGTVEKIHFFFTYLKTPNGQEVTVPNSNMLKAVVTNFTRLGKRRVNFDVGVSFEADIELVKKVFLDIVKDDELVLKEEECIVYVYELGDLAVGVRIRCWTKFDKYWDFYNTLPEKVLLACRKHHIYLPLKTDRQINPEQN